MPDCIAFSGKTSSLRIYDNTPTTPNYIQVVGDVQANFAGALQRPLPTLGPLQLDRGRFDTCANYSVTSDEDLLAPFPISWDQIMRENSVPILHALSNPFEASPWTVDQVTFVPFTTADISIKDQFGNAQAIPAFPDAARRPLVAVEVLFTKTSAGAADFGLRYNGVLFEGGQQQLQSAISEVGMAISGAVYGDVELIAAHTAGTDATA